MNLTDTQMDAVYGNARVATQNHFDQLDYDISGVEQNAFFVRSLIEWIEWFERNTLPSAASHDRRVGDDHLSGEVYWRYTEPAPRGVKLALLTKGKTQTTGVWHDEHGYIAWSLLIPRDKQLETELGL